MKYSIHKEGYPTIALVFILLLALNLAVAFFVCSTITKAIVLVLSVAFFVFILSFFRIPKRTFTQGDNLIMAPADGKVVVIEEVEEPEYFKNKRIQVSIFMSPLNVHVNRSPIDGQVKYVKYHPGKYLVAWHPKSSTENERYTSVIGKGKHDILVRQIAGKLARRIVNYLKVDDKMKQNAEIGFIKFGSRVDLFLPLETNIKVKINDTVQNGISIIGTIDDI